MNKSFLNDPTNERSVRSLPLNANYHRVDGHVELMQANRLEHDLWLWTRQNDRITIP